MKNPPEKLLACPHCNGELVYKKSTFEQVQPSIYECKKCACYLTKNEYNYYAMGCVQGGSSKNWPEKIPYHKNDNTNGMSYKEGFSDCHDAFMAVIGKKEEICDTCGHQKYIGEKCACGQPSQCEPLKDGDRFPQDCTCGQFGNSNIGSLTCPIHRKDFPK